jgi:SAM-dependent methyltransferase
MAPEPMRNDFARYLAAKRSVDDRALNGRVWRRLLNELASSAADPLRIVDAGAGIGTGAERIAEWRLAEPLSKLRYMGVEPREELLEEGSFRLRALPFPAELVSATLAAFAARDGNRGRFDVVVAHALLDVVDLGPALEALVGLSRPGGILYFPIVFDGETLFEPSLEADETILAAYHGTMREEGRTGRKVFHRLRSLRTDVLEMGSSDWIVHPSGSGYPADEAFFLEFILTTIETAVRDRVAASTLDAWVAKRRRQLEAAELLYGAHQLDVLARKTS